MRSFARMQADRHKLAQEANSVQPLVTRNNKRPGIQKKRWIIQPPAEHRIQLAKSLKIQPLLAQVLINRSVVDSQTGFTFLYPKLNQLIRPKYMPGIESAVHRLKQALENKEKITIYGDYDVDGITGVSILWQILNLLGANVDYYIPHRIDEGYGLNTEAVRYLARSGTRVLITVDCGICALASAELAEQIGVDLIITDHHHPQATLPRAVAIVHPALDESYQNQDSSGAMVALKLAWALAEEFSSGPKLEPKLREFMLNATCLAAMGTVADVVELRGENRVLTSYGLKALCQCKLCGIQALIESAGLTGQGLDSFDIGFRLAPMLNAAGRMGHARLAVELLTSDNSTRSMQIAEYLKQQNTQRQQVERKIFKQACEMIFQMGLNHPDRRSIVLANKDWHSGVLGIVASRAVDKFYRPTIMININGDNGMAQGSGRSIPGFCLLSAIRACSHHLQNFGGHTMAAGITIEPGKIESFTAEFEAYASENLNADDVVERLDIDAHACLAELNWGIINQLQLLGPFGQGNPKPIFATKGVRLAAAPRRVGANSEHLQLAITDNTNSIRCIGFGMGKWEKKLIEHDFFNVAYEAQINTYNGNSNVELVLVDIQFE